MTGQRVVDVYTISVTVVSDPAGVVSTPEDVAEALDSGVVTGGVLMITVVEDTDEAAAEEIVVDSPAEDVAVCWHLVQMVLVDVIRTVDVVTPTLVLVTPPEV